ncbi:16306_t:CDS:2 [Funneliformis geosporum]|uniref:16306_t:CDS:1 n=1 Tax=Funneliformis geosporum TaxID=1117311 RepID=A0A9W4X0N5_9GLOM|nr:16306_t:CDS:2 [Funneliformis geosporum]
MQKNYNEWMSESLRELTPAGRIKKPSYETVVNWVNRSWNAINIEDDWIFNYERLGQAKSGDEIEILNDNNENNRNDDIENNHYDENERNYDNEWN